MTDTVTVPSPHVKQELPIEWYAVRAGGEIVVVNSSGESSTAYIYRGLERNPRVIARADAVLWNGAVHHPRYDDVAGIELQHTWAGSRTTLPVDELLDAAVPLLERTDMVSLEVAADD